MSKLKNINLNDLGIKSKNANLAEKLERFIEPEPVMEFARAEHSLPFWEGETKMSKSRSFDERIINNSSNMNSKFLKHINIIENIKDKPGQYLDKRSEWEKDLEPEEFTPPSKQPEKIIPLTFRKFCYRIFPKNITEFALKNPEKLPNLIAEIRNDIQKDAQIWLDFVSDKQISTLLCQNENYSAKGKIYKKSDEFQDIPQVIQWIIDTNTKLRYESADWNKDQAKTFSEEKGDLLIIDTTLDRKIEIEENRESERERQDKKFPLPWKAVWTHFEKVIVFPLKNNFQFIIIDKRALAGWKDFQKLEIKYDETNSTTYFLRKMEGGFKQLTCYNAVAFINE